VEYVKNTDVLGQLELFEKAEYTVNYMIYERKGDEDFTMSYACNRP
jgi:hypothetical protein